MVVSNFFARSQTFAGVSAVAVSVLFGAHPAMANSSNAADIAAPLRAAQEARQAMQGGGDEEFRSLFSSWRDLERQPGFAARPVAIPAPAFGLVAVREANKAKPAGAVSRVSIPSRMPVEGVHLTSGFGMRWHPVTGGRRAHKGVDLAAPTGTPVYASADGVVGRAEWFSSYGLYVQLEHGADIETRYGHMSRLNVYSGQRVRKGDLIGFVGSTGRSTGPHLHYEVRIAGVAVNPIPYMQAGEFQQASAPVAAIGGMGGPERRK